MRYEVTVTDEDIREGKRMGCFTCPVALALNRATGRMALVDICGWRFVGTLDRYDLPEIATNFIRRFDTHQPVAPIAFAVEVADAPGAAGGAV